METTNQVGVRYETPIISEFRKHFQAKHCSVELPYVSLVSNHDPTIRFTNSTTSPMKPYLLSPITDNSTLFMTQPAMGTQGLRHWNDNGCFGIYSSYFVSLGVLNSPEKITECLEDAEEIVVSRWGIPRNKLTLEIFDGDGDLLRAALSTWGEAVCSNNLEEFRHKYGVEELSGKNINLVTSDDLGNRIILGNITMIYYGNQPTACEVSFDSTTVTAVKNGLSHPVEGHLIYGQERPYDVDSLALIDFSSVIAALALEGLEPKSKGRGGVMRRFVKSFHKIRTDLGLNDTSGELYLLDTCRAEIEMRSASMGQPAEPEAYTIDRARTVVSKWLPRLLK